MYRVIRLCRRPRSGNQLRHLAPLRTATGVQYWCPFLRSITNSSRSSAEPQLRFESDQEFQRSNQVILPRLSVKRYSSVGELYIVNKNAHGPSAAMRYQPIENDIGQLI